MTSELVKAIQDRLHHGQTKEEIKSAVLALGHTEVIFEAAYTLALHDSHAVVVGGVDPLPRASDLFMGGWNFVQSRLDLILFLLIPGVISVFLQWLPSSSLSTPLLNKAALGLDFVAMAAYFYCLLMVMYIISSEGVTSKTAAFTWTAKRIHSFLWISILSLLLVIGGLALFVVPGIIVMLLVYFGQYVLVLEDKRGMAALLRSRELVHGRVGSVLGVLFKFWLLLLLPLFLVGLVGGILSAFWSDAASTYLSLLGNLGLEVMVVIINLISVHAMFHLYRVLQTRAGEAATASVKIRYWLLALFGVAMTVLIGVAVFFAASADGLYKNLPITADSVTVENEIRSTALTAREYMLAHSQSYEGVCDTLRPTLSSTEGVTCNDSQESWAISAKSEEGYWCADTDTVLKKIQAELSDRTSCLQLP